MMRFFRMKNTTMSGVEPAKLGKHFTTYAILILCLGAMTFFGVCDPTGRKWGGRMGRYASGGSQAATVGGEVIGKMEFQREYQRSYQQYQRMYQEAFDPGAIQLAHTVLRKMIDDRAMYAKACEQGLKASDEEVLGDIVKEGGFKGEDGKFSEENFNRFLEQEGYSEATFLEYARRIITVQKLRRFVADSSFVSSKAAEIDYRLAETKLDVEYLKFDPQKLDVKVNAPDIDKMLADEKGKARIKEYFESNSKEFNQAEQVKARHILVAFKGARNATAEGAKREKDAAKKRAEEILAKVKAPGADFGQIAKTSTDEEAGKNSGGDLGFFTREVMDKAFSDAAFALEKGVISGIVESPFGFHIIKVEDKKAAITTKLEDVQRKIADTLLAKEKRPALAKERATKVIDKLKAKQPIDDLLKEFGVTWAATGDVAADAKYLPGIGSDKEVGDAFATLAQAGQLYPTPVDVRGNLFVLRLKSHKDADMAKLDKEKRRQLEFSAGYEEGNKLFTMYEKQVRDELEKKDKIWMNPEFLALDEPKTKEETSAN